MKMFELMIQFSAKSLKNFEDFEIDVINVVVKSVKKILGKINEKTLRVVSFVARLKQYVIRKS